MRLLVFLFAVALVAIFVALMDHTAPAGGRRAYFRQIVRGFALQIGDVALITPTAVEELKVKQREKLKTARDIASKAEAENRDFNDAERAMVKQLFEEANALKAQEAKATQDADLLAWVKANDEGIALNTPGPVSKSTGTLGERFVKDAGIDAYLKSLTGAGTGYVGEKTRVQSEAVHFAGLKDILSSGDHDASAGSLVGPDFRGLLDVGTWQRPLTIRDLVSSGSTTSDSVSYARMLDVVNNAAPTPEASGTSAGDASADVTGQKPESSMELEPVTEPVRTIAHWIPMTKRALSDAAQIRTLVDTFLRYGLEEELEDQMVDGDGTSENFEGLMNVSGTQSQAFSTDILVTLRKAKTKAQTIGRGANLAFAVSPATAERQDLIQDTTHQYIGGGPYGVNQGDAWGMRRVVTEAVDDDVMIVGDWRWAVLWDREQAAVMLSDSHADFFTRNLVAALAELRAAFGVIRPAAFVIAEAS